MGRWTLAPDKAAGTREIGSRADETFAAYPDSKRRSARDARWETDQLLQPLWFGASSDLCQPALWREAL